MFSLPTLPYAYDALAPAISERALCFHHDKHHAGYVKTLNALLKATGALPEDLETVIRGASHAADRKLFNNAAQAWNHSFFWTAMTATPGQPDRTLGLAIATAFDSLEGLRSAFVAQGVGHFGSGWAWLAADQTGRLTVLTTHDANDMLFQAELTPLLVCDLWEHAYYLDHQNDRQGFLEAWFDALPNWSFAAAQFAAARGQGDAWRYPRPTEQLRRVG